MDPPTASRTPLPHSPPRGSLLVDSAPRFGLRVRRSFTSWSAGPQPRLSRRSRHRARRRPAQLRLDTVEHIAPSAAATQPQRRRAARVRRRVARGRVWAPPFAYVAESNRRLSLASPTKTDASSAARPAATACAARTSRRTSVPSALIPCRSGPGRGPHGCPRGCFCRAGNSTHNREAKRRAIRSFKTRNAAGGRDEPRARSSPGPARGVDLPGFLPPIFTPRGR